MKTIRWTGRWGALAGMLLGAGVFVVLGACSDRSPSATGESITDRLQLQLIEAKPGAVVSIPPGRHHITRSLSLTQSDVTVRGAGAAVSVLSFRGQTQGAEGLLVQNARNIVLEGFAVEDAAGDAIKINQVDGLTVRDVRTEWTGGPKSENGAYGIYPVQCQNVLIDGATAIGASDAGIYVGQSSRIIVRNSRAAFNVAGIEIENSTFADVYNNDVTNNTGGILVFDLPDLPVQGGRNTRVFNNRVVANNTPNFAPAGNIVGTVPAGSGLMINANDSIEVFGNTFADNQSAHIIVVSYLITGRPVNDPNYDPYPETIFIHDNRYQGGGDQPDSEPLQALIAAAGGPVPDIVWDGFVDADKLAAGVAADSLRVCIAEPDTVRFVNLDAPGGFKAPSFDRAPHACRFERLSAVVL